MSQSTTRVIVGKRGTGSLYAASKTSATVNTATNPESLRNGSVGVYGLQGVDAVTAGNTGKWVLITNATNAAGKAAKNNFTGKLIKICVGDDSRVSGYVESGIIDMTSGFSVDAKASEAYTKQISYLGYSLGSTSGNLNMQALPDYGDVVGFKSYLKKDGAYEQEIQEFSMTVYEDEKVFDMLSRLVTQVAATTYASNHWTLGIVCNATTGTNPTESLTIVQGSDQATIGGADTDYAAGVYIGISGNVYKILAKDTLTLTLDRAVTEASATVANTGVDILTVTEFPTANYTKFGISITNTVDNENFSYSVAGVIEEANIDYYQGTAHGSGLGQEVIDMERQALPYRGNMHTAQVEFLQSTPNGVQTPQPLASASLFYDIYMLYSGVYLGDKDFATPQNVQTQKTVVAFEVPSLGSGAGNTSTHNQADFEDIMVQFYSSTPAISA